MNPDKIVLEDINKMLTYEQQARAIDKLNEEEAKEFAKAYCKLYLQQQEVVANFVKTI